MWPVVVSDVGATWSYGAIAWGDMRMDRHFRGGLTDRVKGKGDVAEATATGFDGVTGPGDKSVTLVWLWER